jgi:hypothetical protein
MKKFVIQPHFRLQEWVADEKGYFTAEGLDYVFNEEVQATDGKVHDKGQKVGAYQSFESGRASDVSCACHWTVNVAASSGLGKLYPDAYSVAPAELRKYFHALQRAQRDIDLRPEAYTHFYQNEFPVRFHTTMDTTRWGPGERIVFEPYLLNKGDGLLTKLAGLHRAELRSIRGSFPTLFLGSAT